MPEQKNSTNVYSTPDPTPLPYDVDAERALLGALLVDNNLAFEVADKLKENDFFVEQHKKIFSSIMHLHQAGKAFDEVILKTELDSTGLKPPISLEFLSRLRDGVPRLSNISSYVEIIKEKAVRRNLIEASYQIIEQSQTESEDKNTMGLLKKAEDVIFELSQSFIKKKVQPLSTVIADTFEYLTILYKNKNALTGVPTGFKKLDEITHGFQKGELVIIAARPGMGKTSFALNVAINAALKYEKSVAIFSLEMSARQLALRLLSAETKIDSHKMALGILNDKDWEILSLTIGKMDKMKLFIDDTGKLTPLELQTVARRLDREYGLDMIIVDYLQLMSGDRKYENRVQEIAVISRSLKALAKELDIPVVALSQLSRAPESRKGEDHRPRLSDLRESGSIEQDADVVAFIYRPEMYKSSDEREQFKGQAELIIAKQRNGPVGNIPLTFVEQYTLFIDPAPSDE